MRRIPKAAFPYHPTEIAGADGICEWWTRGSLSFLLLAGAVSFSTTAPS